MTWDGKERRSDDHASRIASLEAYSKTQHSTILELKNDIRCIRSGIEGISKDLHAAKVGGRVLLAVAGAIGGVIGWTINLLNP